MSEEHAPTRSASATTSAPNGCLGFIGVLLVRYCPVSCVDRHTRLGCLDHTGLASGEPGATAWPACMQLLHTVIGNGRRVAFGSSKSTGYADFRPGACADIPYFGVRNSVSTRFMEESPRREGWLAERGSARKTSLGSRQGAPHVRGSWRLRAPRAGWQPCRSTSRQGAAMTRSLRTAISDSAGCTTWASLVSSVTRRS